MALENFRKIAANYKDDPDVQAMLQRAEQRAAAAPKPMPRPMPTKPRPGTTSDRPVGGRVVMSGNTPAPTPGGVGRGTPMTMRKGGKAEGMKKYANGGSVGSASKRADGIASRGKTKCKMY